MKRDKMIVLEVSGYSVQKTFSGTVYRTVSANTVRATPKTMLALLYIWKTTKQNALQ
jgi:hypothetical protein